MKIWQILPLNPVGYGNSPYQPYSSCAGDEIYISLEKLWEQKLLKELPVSELAGSTRVQYEQVRTWKETYLREAFQAFIEKGLDQTEEYQTFAAQKWVQEYGLFYVGVDSVDVWAGKKNFLLDTDGRPIFIAGVPPDYFSATGQRWGNPIYDWEYLKKQNYQFWVDRIGYSNRLFDIIRIDHFRAFDTFWKIPASCPTAVEGEWILAPGYEVIDTLLEQIPGVNLVAEDLGDLRPEVLELKE